MYNIKLLHKMQMGLNYNFGSLGEGSIHCLGTAYFDTSVNYILVLFICIYK